MADFVERYLAQAAGDLPATTLRDRRSYLRDDGPLLRYFGERKLDEITAPMLRAWWGAEIQARGLSAKTGRGYLDTLSSVLGYARDLGLVESSPIGDFREMLRRGSRTKKARAEAEPGRSVRPIEDAEPLARLVASAREEGSEAEVLVLLCLDGGLRVGEASALRWGAIEWGTDETDTSRALRVEESRPRGGEAETPKSGRRRRVALSLRLRRVLHDLYRARFEPSPEALVVDVEPNNFRHREWRRIVKRAGLAGQQLKDLRDTFASHLLTAGVQLGYVSAQLGHADVSVTARHYARWCGGDDYREPMHLAPGEVPADFLARLDEGRTVSRARSASAFTTSRAIPIAHQSPRPSAIGAHDVS